MKKIAKFFLIISIIGFLITSLTLTVINNKDTFLENINTTRKSDDYKGLNKIEKLNLIAKSIENTLNEKIFLKDQYIDLYGAFQKLLLKRVVHEKQEVKNTILTINGQLTAAYPKGDITKYTQKINSLGDFASKNKIYMAYIDIPWRNREGDLPFYIKDYCDETRNNLLKSLNNNVSVIHLEETLGTDPTKIFYNTDHHWNTDAAFKSFQYILKDLDSHLNLKLNDDILYNYNREVYEDIFLGTYGKKVGQYYGGWDDFVFITPNFDTELKVVNYRNVGKIESEKNGTFAETLTYPKYLNKNLDRDLSVYYTYGEGTKAEVNIINLKATNNKKLLILKDSYADSVYPFLSLGFKQTKVVDVRRYVNIRLFTYINKFKPDAIIFLQSPLDLYTNDLIKFQEL